MPSTRKQKAKGRRSRQMDLMSDVEKVDIMLGSYSRDENGNDGSENEVNLDSGSSTPPQNSNLVGEEDFRSLLNTNSRENSDITVETTRMISEKLSSQMSRKLDEIKNSLNFQIQDAINNAITEKVLPSIQNTLEKQGRLGLTVVDRGSNELHPSLRTANSTIEDLKSSERHRNPEAENVLRSWEKRSKTFPNQLNCRQRSRDSSVESFDGEQNHDMIAFQILNVDCIEWFCSYF